MGENCCMGDAQEARMCYLSKSKGWEVETGLGRREGSHTKEIVREGRLWQRSEQTTSNAILHQRSRIWQNLERVEQKTPLSKDGGSAQTRSNLERKRTANRSWGGIASLINVALLRGGEIDLAVTMSLARVGQRRFTNRLPPIIERHSRQS